MANGPLTAGLLGGLDIRRQREAQNIQRQQLAQQQQRQDQQFQVQQQQLAQKQMQLDIGNADKLLELGFGSGNVDMIGRATEIYNKHLGTSFDAETVFEKSEDFKKRSKAIQDFASLPEVKTNPNLQQALVDEIRRADADFSGALGVSEDKIEDLEGLVPGRW